MRFRLIKSIILQGQGLISLLIGAPKWICYLMNSNLYNVSLCQVGCIIAWARLLNWWAENLAWLPVLQNILICHSRIRNLLLRIPKERNTHWSNKIYFYYLYTYLLSVSLLLIANSQQYLPGVSIPSGRQKSKLIYCFFIHPESKETRLTTGLGLVTWLGRDTQLCWAALVQIFIYSQHI